MAELERLGVAQVIQYADDVLEAWTNDGERFLVSGCCTAFTHWKRLRNSCEQTHHYTHFCLSAYKKQMAALVQFRNCYSERPFLCSSLVNDKSRVRYRRNQFNIYVHIFVFPLTLVFSGQQKCVLAPELIPGEAVYNLQWVVVRAEIS